MTGLESAVERLRPLVASKTWDYCVVWKLGNDPSRFIEWMGCCCSGGGCADNEVSKVKEEKQLGPFCKDVNLKHPISTMACEALARLPSFMPLYSGNHGEVVISTQPRWISFEVESDLNSSPEAVGTQVLIPVIGGLIELFSAKNMLKDEKVVEFIIARCNVDLKREASISHEFDSGFNEPFLAPFLEDKLQSSQTPSHLLSSVSWVQVHPLLTQPNTHTSIEGSSSGSNLSIEHPSFVSCSDHLPQYAQLKHSIGNSDSRKSEYDSDCLVQQSVLLPDCNSNAAADILRVEKGNYQSKNLVTERNRRKRIKDGLHALRALVPKISKMDKASILGDAIDYIGELQKQAKELQDELDETESEQYEMHNSELRTLKLESLHEGCRDLPSTEKNRSPSVLGEKKTSEVQVELHEIGKRNFLIRFFCEQKRGGFGRLINKLEALGFQVVDANITTFRGNVLNVLIVEAYKKDARPKKLRDSLMEL